MTTEEIFCDFDLNDYEKTIYSLAISFGVRGSYIIKDEDISNIATLLSVDYNLLCKALSFYNKDYIPLQIKFGTDVYIIENFHGADLFHALIIVYFIYRNLEEITDGTSYEAILDNYKIFQCCIGEFEFLNALTSTVECMYKKYYSVDFAVFNNSNYQPKNELNLLRSFITTGHRDIFDRKYLPFLYRIISYELITRVNSIYLITITQIIKHSDFMSNDIKEMSNEMYDYLLYMVQNARIISVQTNFLPPLRSEHSEIRDKYDNTTRLQIIYGYENYDSYVLRLDLAHKGQELIHYNNKSPGGIKCCLFTHNEYNSIIKESPVAKVFFVKYGSRYALKELNNLDISKELLKVYEEIRNKKEHTSAFNNTYDENDIVKFINIISLMLPSNCLVHIDFEEKHARSCFNYNKIMYYAILLEIAFLSHEKNDFQKILKLISTTASRYGLILEDSTDEFSNIEGFCLIIDEAKSKINSYKPS